MLENFTVFNLEYYNNIKKSIINNPSTKKDFLKQFLKDENLEIRLSVINSPYCTKEILLEALKTECEETYREAERKLKDGRFSLSLQDINNIKVMEDDFIQRKQNNEPDSNLPLAIDVTEGLETFGSGSFNTSLWQRLKLFFDL